jgi:hypothetical protein
MDSHCAALVTRALGGASRGRSERGRSEAVAPVRGKVWVTAVPSAKCGGGNGHCDRPVQAVRPPAQQRVQPAPPLPQFGPEKVPVVQPALPEK